MTYSVKEIYYTIQGEGMRTGRPAVLLRFTGCNLWSGREEDRAKAICQFCDTDFRHTDGPGGGKFSLAGELADATAKRWPGGGTPYVVCTGGEPLLQLDAALVSALKDRGFEVAVETNGTLPVPTEVDWICVSPKAGAPLIQVSGHELKLVYPQDGCIPADFEALAFDHFLLQPMDGPDLAANTQAAIRYCLEWPQWKLSLQTHKILGLR